MPTNQGLPNIENPGDLTYELRRIVRGTFLAISHFFPVEDATNRAVIEKAGLEAFVYKESALNYFTQAAWKVAVENACTSSALPTPESEIFEGARADGLPVAPTKLEWCTLRAESK